VGRVSFSNTVPLFYRLTGFEVVEGLPSELALKLRRGEIGAGIVSSVEYFFNPHLYLVLPGVSISSRGKVCSVKLFSKKPIEELKKVKVTRASLTSKYLLHYVAEKVYGVRLEETEEGEEGVLLIGDEAMEERDYPYAYDLGEEWFKLHRLPFVFALFLVRREVRREEALRLLEEVKESVRSFYGGEVENRYFKECIDYGLGKAHEASLRKFFEFLEEKTGKPAPPLRFLS